MKEALWGIFAGIIIVCFYILWAYSERDSDVRLKYLIKNIFTERGDGSINYEPYSARVINIEILSSTVDEVTCTVEYEINNIVYTKNMIYKKEPICRMDCIPY